MKKPDKKRRPYESLERTHQSKSTENEEEAKKVDKNTEKLNGYRWNQEKRVKKK